MVYPSWDVYTHLTADVCYRGTTPSEHPQGLWDAECWLPAERGCVLLLVVSTTSPHPYSYLVHVLTPLHIY